MRGLVGGWSAVRSLRRSGEKVLADERILGTDDFVGRVLGEAEGRTRHQSSSLVTGKRVQQLIETTCKKEGVYLRDLQMGSRRGAIPKVRSHLAWKLIQDLGFLWRRLPGILAFRPLRSPRFVGGSKKLSQSCQPRPPKQSPKTPKHPK
jgi:hypothetical protein